MRLVILGAGGYGQTVGDIAAQCGKYEESFFLDDNPNAVSSGKLSDFTHWIDASTEFIPAFGNNDLRLGWCQHVIAVKGHLATVIHPSAYLSPTAILHSGIVVLPKAIVNSRTIINSGCIINCGAIIDHDCVIGEGCHICLGAIVKANNKIPPKTKIEAGQVVENAVFQ